MNCGAVEWRARLNFGLVVCSFEGETDLRWAGEQGAGKGGDFYGDTDGWMDQSRIFSLMRERQWGVP